jgi:hypothetical protein
MALHSDDARCIVPSDIRARLRPVPAAVIGRHKYITFPQDIERAT